MSGYLPPRTVEGPWSELYTPECKLKKSDISGGTNEKSEHWLRIPDDVVPTTNTLITLGEYPNNPLVKFQPLGFGLWGWGDLITYGFGPSGGYDQKLNDESCYSAWKAMFKNCNDVLLDTAEHYGYTDGYSEKEVGTFWSREQEKETLDRSRITFNTKYLPTPWRHPWKYPDIMLQAFHGSLDRSKMEYIDVYQLHGPSHFGFWPRLETLCEGFVKIYQTGRCRAIGTCNLSFEQVKYVYSYLKKHGVPLVSNQVEFSLLRQDPWSTGLVEKCHKLGIATIAYSPLALGRLTGKYNAHNRPRGNRNFGDISWTKIQPVLEELERIGAKYGKRPAAVALNWIICKGAIPIPMAKNDKQVEDCLQALGWRLEKEDENKLDVIGLTNAWDWNLLKHAQNWWWEQG